MKRKVGSKTYQRFSAKLNSDRSLRKTIKKLTEKMSDVKTTVFTIRIAVGEAGQGCRSHSCSASSRQSKMKHVPWWAVPTMERVSFNNE
jgi:hypothetical protein